MKKLILLLTAAIPSLVFAQHVGIGTTSPTAPLDVNGTIRIRGGNPASDAVLTSDAQGYASWKARPQKALGAGLAAFQTLPKSSFDKIEFAVQPDDDNGHLQFNQFGNAFNNATHEFTVPADGGGIYEVATALLLGISGGSATGAYNCSVLLTLERNGQLISAGYSITTIPPSVVLQTIPVHRKLLLQPGDKLYVRASHDITSSGGITVSNGIGESYLNISRVH